MTRDRRQKHDIRAAAADSGTRYTRARQHTLAAPGANIGAYQGDIHICSACAQPAYRSSQGASHFAEQDGGVFCPAYPAAVGLLRMDWKHSFALDSVRQKYPWPFSPTGSECDGGHWRGRFRDFTGEVVVCGSCGQPACDGEYGWEHFTDQWDGVFCDWFPLAGRPVRVTWHPRSLAEWKAGYRCSYPHGS
ncbi:hypothetical protein A4E84_14345 [Streptomyces qaidamensis]|uniref:Uncharacterized protein n=1 Tax=Streptomyces qaidamensis TaxID=1783515 RepID=A0A143C049_9ACTN|nr:hypothetical protein [Streptomyces qaidamensis]AMW10580.1 hypothetical protein A4E84_14345 [Streptomyces qaidamensis]